MSASPRQRTYADLADVRDRRKAGYAVTVAAAGLWDPESSAAYWHRVRSRADLHARRARRACRSARVIDLSAPPEPTPTKPRRTKGRASKLPTRAQLDRACRAWWLARIAIAADGDSAGEQPAHRGGQVDDGVRLGALSAWEALRRADRELSPLLAVQPGREHVHAGRRYSLVLVRPPGRRKGRMLRGACVALGSKELAP
jgi:hypothetical protein